MAVETGGGRQRAIGLVVGGAAFLLLLLFPVDPGNAPASRLAAVAVLMAVWWVTDAIPLFATALLPLALYPVLGILPGSETAPVYFNSTILLFLGGFMIALTMERWNLHRRIALKIIHLVGAGPSRIVLGFMLAAAFLSMWISNTATAVMMVPIGLAIILQLEDSVGREKARHLAVGLMLGIAYGATVGGITTLVGTPPNLSFVRIFAILFPDAPPIAFGQWMIMALPIGAILLVVSWLLITQVFHRAGKDIGLDSRVVEEERARLGPMSREEGAVLVVFASTALLWVFRVELKLGDFMVPGWSSLFPDPAMIDDGTVAIFMASLLFFIPARSRRGKTRRVMEAEVIPRLPWHIVLLFGGGFALAEGFQRTGLAQLVGSQFQALGSAPPWLMILAICVALTFLTELTSNTATTEMVLPILAAVAVASGIHPLLIMVPATLSASCAFMMPVATPPNAIVFGSERITVGQMARTGIFLNLIGVVVITIVVLTIGLAVLGVDPTEMPEWARSISGRNPS